MQKRFAREFGTDVELDKTDNVDPVWAEKGESIEYKYSNSKKVAVILTLSPFKEI
jgi:hypothetical protein